MTTDGSLTMRHPEHGECYHSTQGARFEADSLYIDASGFRRALAKGQPLTVFDVGLGLGYNALATLAAWQAEPAAGPLTLISFEIVPDLVFAMATGEAPWQAGWSDDERAMFSALEPASAGQWRVRLLHQYTGVPCAWDIHVGDAVALLATLSLGAADYIWQDPFSPAKNPSMWSAGWFTALRPHVGRDAQLVTYSVARSVRDALEQSGWRWEKIKTATKLKKHWLRARPQTL